MMKDQTLQTIRQGRLVPVVVLEDAGLALDLTDTLLGAGLRVMEVTFRTQAAADAIARVASERRDMFIGAGTLLTPDNIRQAVDAGATFGVAPGLSESTVRAARQAGLDLAPGVMTPSDVERALQLDCRVLKFFPAEQAGGVAMLKALEGPYRHTGVQFIPTGGINPSNLSAYLALGSVAAVGGSWFVDKKLIAARDWDGIGRLTREALGKSSSP
jgi:2-dehydro-3-deoxyphosphogluconate aldolase/(4S)-4-hydroxy-2-oxoglutarate aldolase